MSTSPPGFDDWYAALEARHLKELTFQEVRRALQALSSLYVERRSTAGVDRALESPGKRAAFALFYAPLHLLQVYYVVKELSAGVPPPSMILDLGCGTGSAGIGWALGVSAAHHPRVSGVDLNQWALAEARWNSSFFGLEARTIRDDAARVSWSGAGAIAHPGRPVGIVLAFTVNEMEERSRSVLLDRLLERNDGSRAILIVEPVAKRMSPWWDAWSVRFESAGGRVDQWRFVPQLPERLSLLDKAAGLNHREMKCRTLWLPAKGK